MFMRDADSLGQTGTEERRHPIQIRYGRPVLASNRDESAASPEGGNRTARLPFRSFGDSSVLPHRARLARGAARQGLSSLPPTAARPHLLGTVSGLPSCRYGWSLCVRALLTVVVLRLWRKEVGRAGPQLSCGAARR